MRATVFRRLGNGDEQIGQIDFQVSAVGGTLLRVHIQAEGDVFVRDLKPAKKAAQYPQAAFDLVACPCQSIQFKEQAAQMGGYAWAKGLVFVRLDKDGPVSFGSGQAFDFIEQHRLAHTAQPGQQHAFFSSFELDPSEQNPRLFKNGLATDTLGWRGARAGGIRIFDWVHIYLVISNYKQNEL